MAHQIKMVVVAEEGEIRTKGEEPAHNETNGMGRQVN